MEIVDAQVHLNKIGIEEGLAAMTALGISAAVVDEYTSLEGERFKPYALVGNNIPRPLWPVAEAASVAHPDRLAYLVRLDYRDPELEAIVRVLRGSPGCKALRVCLFFDQEFKDFSAGAHRNVFKLAADYNFPLFVNLIHGELLDPYFEEFRSAPLIVDHCGIAVTPDKFEHVLKFSRFANVSYKWAHAPMVLGSPAYPFPELNPKLRRVVDAFGADRVMWASDTTEIQGGHSWAEILFHIRDNPVLSATEKEWILARTVRKILDWPAPKKD